jgi:hypothetical protein
MEQEPGRPHSRARLKIWTAHGCVDGQADQHWLAAEREILARAAISLVGNSIPQPKQKKNR